MLARAIFNEGVKSVAAGINPMDIRRGIEEATKHILSELKNNSTEIQSNDEIQQVAAISANSDQVIGGLIATAMEKVGKSGVITVQDGKKLDDELEVVEGMRFDRGYISPYFATDSKSQKCELENPLILFHEGKISSLQQLLPVLEMAMKESRGLLICAEDVEGEALAALVVNKLRGNLKVCAVKAPGFGDNRKANLQDMAILTNGIVISEDLGMKLETTTIEQLGTAKTVTVSKDDTVILDGAGEKQSIEERCDLLNDSIEQTTSEYEKEKLQERLAKLSGGVAVIKVGGASETEVSEKKDRLTDSLNATRAAVEDGIISGGGSALLHASKTLGSLKDNAPNMDHKIGIEIIESAIRKPLHAIAENAGFEGSVIVGKVLEKDDKNVGFNAQTGEYVNMISAGILDPTRVTSVALQDASSVASLMITTEALVCDIPSDTPDPMAAAGAGGMGGMGGMPGMM